MPSIEISVVYYSLLHLLIGASLGWFIAFTYFTDCGSGDGAG